jgi:hypothetical protein
MRCARDRGALVGRIGAWWPEGLQGLNLWRALVAAGVPRHDIHVLASFIFGLPSDRAATFDATVATAERADITFAQFLMLTPFPGTTDFAEWERMMATDGTRIDGLPLTRHWLIPQSRRPKAFLPHPDVARRDLPWHAAGTFPAGRMLAGDRAASVAEVGWRSSLLEVSVVREHRLATDTARAINALGAVDCEALP